MSASVTPPYTVTVQDERIEAVCSCGASVSAPDKGLGRALVAAWKTQHQHIADSGAPK